MRSIIPQYNETAERRYPRFVMPPAAPLVPVPPWQRFLLMVLFVRVNVPSMSFPSAARSRTPLLLPYHRVLPQ